MFETIQIAVAYKNQETGEELPASPADLFLLARVDVVYG